MEVLIPSIRTKRTKAPFITMCAKQNIPIKVFTKPELMQTFRQVWPEDCVSLIESPHSCLQENFNNTLQYAKDNNIHWFLRVDDDLNRTYHFNNGQVVKNDIKGWLARLDEIVKQVDNNVGMLKLPFGTFIKEHLKRSTEKGWSIDDDKSKLQPGICYCLNAKFMKDHNLSFEWFINNDPVYIFEDALLYVKMLKAGGISKKIEGIHWLSKEFGGKDSTNANIANYRTVELEKFYRWANNYFKAEIFAKNLNSKKEGGNAYYIDRTKIRKQFGRI